MGHIGLPRSSSEEVQAYDSKPLATSANFQLVDSTLYGALVIIETWLIPSIWLRERSTSLGQSCFQCTINATIS